MRTGSGGTQVIQIQPPPSELNSLRQWLEQADGVSLSVSSGIPEEGAQGVEDILTAVGAGGALIALIQVLPEYLKSRRSDITLKVTSKDTSLELTATNVEEAMDIIKKIIDDE